MKRSAMKITVFIIFWVVEVGGGDAIMESVLNKKKCTFEGRKIYKVYRASSSSED